MSAPVSTVDVRRFISRLGVTGIGQALTFVIGLGNQVVVARSLGVSGYGQYALVVASAALLGWFLNLGLTVATPALVRGDLSRARTVLAWAGSYLAVLGALVWATSGLLPPSFTATISPSLGTVAGKWLLPTSIVSLAYV